MPTGSEYFAAKVAFDRLFDALPVSFQPIDQDWSSAVQGCRLADTIDEAIAASRRMVIELRERYFDLGNVCTRRQRVCEEYDEKLRKYQQQIDEYKAADPAKRQEMGTPTRPPSPPVWVTPTVEVVE